MSDYALLVPEKEHLRIRIPGDLVEPFDRLCKKKNLSKQGAIERLLRFWVVQEDLAQSMIVGQVEPMPDLVNVVLSRLVRTGDRTGELDRQTGTLALPHYPATEMDDEDLDEGDPPPPAKKPKK